MGDLLERTCSTEGIYYVAVSPGLLARRYGGVTRVIGSSMCRARGGRKMVVLV
jgi:hypothetical protein